MLDITMTRRSTGVTTRAYLVRLDRPDDLDKIFEGKNMRFIAPEMVRRYKLPMRLNGVVCQTADDMEKVARHDPATLQEALKAA